MDLQRGRGEIKAMQEASRNEKLEYLRQALPTKKNGAALFSFEGGQVDLKVVGDLTITSTFDLTEAEYFRGRSQTTHQHDVRDQGARLQDQDMKAAEKETAALVAKMEQTMDYSCKEKDGLEAVDRQSPIQLQEGRDKEADCLVEQRHYSQGAATAHQMSDSDEDSGSQKDYSVPAGWWWWAGNQSDFANSGAQLARF